MKKYLNEKYIKALSILFEFEIFSFNWSGFEEWGEVADPLLVKTQFLLFQRLYFCWKIVGFGWILQKNIEMWALKNIKCF